MSRLLLLSILVLWMCPRDNVRPVMEMAPALMLFLGVYALLVAAMSAWSRALARRVSDDYLGNTLNRYNQATELARYLIPVWFGVGIFALGWGKIVYDLLVHLDPPLPRALENRWITENYWRFPALLLGSLPPLLAWMGLWWAQYPADRALKEQSLLHRANEGLPIHAPPGLGTFFVEHFRQQVLFTLLPVILIVVARDVMALTWNLFALRPMPRDGGDWIIFPVALGIFILAPEILRRLIPTRPMPQGWRLRRRLERLCQRAGLSCRDILIWRTNSSIGNAMVMGLFPRVRYVFLSDLLLETMTDEEIEAVFAHEIGHIVHHHMWWYLIFIAILTLLVAGPIALAMSFVPTLARSADLQAQVATILGLALFAVLFGFFSRRFERQADVYAARTMQFLRGSTAGSAIAVTADTAADGPMQIRHFNPDEPALAGALLVPELAPAALGPSTQFHSGGSAAADSADPVMPAVSTHRTYVGEYGAAVVASALQRVARVNNIPLAAHEWLHGSIATRMQYLQRLSSDTTRTAHFDRYMRRLYWSLLGMLAMLGVWFVLQYGLTGIIGPA